MGRLQRHQQKKYRSQIIGYLFLLVILIIFIATIGIKLLIGTSLFIVNLTQKNKKTQDISSNTPDTILPPEIFNVQTATNTPEIALQIRSTPKKKLSIYINELKQKVIVTLEKGSNTVSLVMNDPVTKTTKKSRLHTIIYKDEKPSLEITSPHDLDKTSKSEIQIEGSTENEIAIRINNIPVIVDGEGKFSFTFKLKEGENHITIIAEDIADNRETKEMTLYYQKEN